MSQVGACRGWWGGGSVGWEVAVCCTSLLLPCTSTSHTAHLTRECRSAVWHRRFVSLVNLKSHSSHSRYPPLRTRRNKESWIAGSSNYQFVYFGCYRPIPSLFLPIPVNIQLLFLEFRSMVTSSKLAEFPHFSVIIVTILSEILFTFLYFFKVGSHYIIIFK